MAPNDPEDESLSAQAKPSETVGRLQERPAIFNESRMLSRYPHVPCGFPSMSLKIYELRADDSRRQRRESGSQRESLEPSDF